MKKYNDLAAAILMAIAFVIIGAGSARAATYTVTNVNDSGAGSLREAIAAANATPDNDFIQFSEQVFGQPFGNTVQTIRLGSQLEIAGNGGSLTINGTGARNLSLLATPSNPLFRLRIFYLPPNAALVLRDMTITGYREIDGGAIHVDTASLTLDAVAVTNSSAQRGGGIFNTLGVVNISNSTVSGNNASSGGGIASFGGTDARDPTRLNIVNSTISGNSASTGGGILSTSIGATTLNFTTVAGNSATGGEGGGIFAGRFINVSNSIVADNTARDSGADF